MASKSAPIAVDLFCGAGGLTRGLQQAGFRVAVGVELNASAAATYSLNNPDATVINKDIRQITGPQIEQVLGGRLALLAACPPCQGFTSLTSKFRRDDERNDLPLDVLRLTRSLRPAAVMFENVPRFATSKRGVRRFNAFRNALVNLGYRVSWDILQAADFGTAQMRSRLIVFAAKTEITPPSPTHSSSGRGGLPEWRSVREAIGGQDTAEVFGASKKRRTLADWHVVRSLSHQNIERLRAAKPGGARWDLPDHLRPDCHKGSSKGFINVYGRMRWSVPSPTITGGCTSPSKGRFGHPQALRTISVMEAALLQDFPKGHKIATQSIDEACTMIGNAFPSRLAAAAAKQVAAVL